MKVSLEEIIESYLDGSLSEQQKLAFAEKLDADPSMRESFVRYLEESHDLAIVAAEARQPAPVERPRFRPTIIRRAMFLAASAAAIFLLGFVFFFSRPAGENGLAYKPSTVGRVTSGELAMEGRTDAFRIGQLVPPGLIETRDQSAAVQFDNGSSIALFPGARADLTGIAELRLLQGRISGQTGEGANELVVHLGENTITDLGTGFGVEIAENGDTEVHVLEGTVRLEGRHLRKQLLTEGNALRLRAEREAESIPLQADAFASEFREPDLGPVGFVHYSFDDPTGGAFEDTGARISDGPFAAAPTDAERPPHSVQARFGKGVTFEEGHGLDSTFPGIGGDQSRSIAVWIKVDQSENTMSLIRWGKRKEAQRWEVLLKANRDGSLVTRTEIGNGYVLGSQNLADGKWHHFVSVYLGGNEGTVEQRIRHYVDGELDPIQRYQPNSADIDTSIEGDSGMQIGRYRLDKSRYPFSGIMDEVYVFDRALTPLEVRELYRDNQPPSVNSP